MDALIFFILLGLGLLAGIIAGLFGIGGGILFTPILFVLFSNAGIPQPVVLTIGTSLFCVFIASSGSTLRQYRQSNIFWREGIKVGLLGVIGVSLGKWVIISSWYSQQVFVLFFSILLLFVAYRFARCGAHANRTIYKNKKVLTLSKAAATGGLGGFVAALGGIGGGGVMVPIMNLYYRIGFQKAVSLSSLAIVLISLAGWLLLGFTSNTAETLTAYSWGYIDFGAALPLASGGLIGGIAGARFNLKIKRRYLQYAFALLAVGMAVKLLLEVFWL